MSLATQSLMVQDDGLLRRIAAAASHHGIRDALPWAVDHAWLVTATEGWADRYHEASKNDPPVEPAAWYGIHGAKPDVITDEMILDAVRELATNGPTT